jgi:hypothetical protein
MPLEAITPIDPHQFFTRHQPGALEGHRLDTRVSGLAVSTDFSGRLNLTTAEGDTVTLTADLESDFRTGTYRARLEADHAAVSVGARTTQFSIQQDFGIAVSGHLNEQELHDLEKLFQNISQLFREFVEGQGAYSQVQAAKLAERLSGFDTLSSLDLSLEIIRSVTVVTGATGTSGEAPETAAAIPQSSTGTTAPTPSVNTLDGSSLNASGQNGPLASLIQQVFDALKEAEAELPKLHTYLAELFEKLQDDLLQGTPTGYARQVDEQGSSKEQGEGNAPLPSVNSQVVAAYSSVSLTALSFSLQG